MTFFECSARRMMWAAGWLSAAFLLAGCIPRAPGTPPQGPQTVTNVTNDTSVLRDIPLQSGDAITVDLTGTPDTIPQANTILSGVGTLSLPRLQTNVTAIGKTPHDLEKEIHDLYISSGVYTSINVTVTPGIRYYYVSGELNQSGGGGKQIYSGKVTVLGAISAGGGFNNFAARKRVQLTRQDGKIFIEDCKKALKDPSLDLEVFPGDRIFVDKQTPWEAITGQ